MALVLPRYPRYALSARFFWLHGRFMVSRTRRRERRNAQAGWLGIHRVC
jgi:hypothetical protein